jgi:hypothetical protein
MTAARNIRETSVHFYQTTLYNNPEEILIVAITRQMAGCLLRFAFLPNHNQCICLKVSRLPLRTASTGYFNA